jgi:hypothetical protein
VELRSHPLMVYRGMPNWPRVWIQKNEKSTKTLSGELGTLNRTVMHDLISRRFFLLIEYEKEYYLGCLMFDDATFVGRSIHDIGGIDLRDKL